ncbi:hypothetical protein D3C87_465790 [compost metagenome]
MSVFHITLKITHFSGTITNEATVIGREGIEYNSDILEVEKQAAIEFQAKKATLLGWRELNGWIRPGSQYDESQYM